MLPRRSCLLLLLAACVEKPEPETLDDYLGTYAVIESRRNGEVGSDARVSCAELGPITPGPAFLTIARDDLGAQPYAVFDCATTGSCEFMSGFEVPQIETRLAVGDANGSVCLLQAEHITTRVDDGLLTWQRLRWSSRIQLNNWDYCTDAEAERLFATAACEQVTSLAARRID